MQKVNDSTFNNNDNNFDQFSNSCANKTTGYMVYIHGNVVQDTQSQICHLGMVDFLTERIRETVGQEHSAIPSLYSSEADYKSLT